MVLHLGEPCFGIVAVGSLLAPRTTVLGLHIRSDQLVEVQNRGSPQGIAVTLGWVPDA